MALSTPLKEYSPSTDNATTTLGKICRILYAVVKGDAGFLVRGTVMAGANTSTTAVTTNEFSKTVASTATPEKLTNVQTLVTEAIIVPLRTNTNPVKIGTSSADNDQHISVPFVLTAPDGKKIDLSTIYVDVTTNGEGVRVLAIS